jgi:hypothetical protein
VRRAGGGLAVLIVGVRFFRVLLAGGLRCLPLPAGEDVHRGLVGRQDIAGGERGEHRLIQPGLPSMADSRALALSTHPAETGAPSSMPMT